MKFNPKKCISNMLTLAGIIMIVTVILLYIVALFNQYIGYINM